MCGALPHTPPTRAPGLRFFQLLIPTCVKARLSIFSQLSVKEVYSINSITPRCERISLVNRPGSPLSTTTLSPAFNLGPITS